MRVALIASARFPVSEPFAGGLEAHTWALAKTLADRGHQVEPFAAPGSDPALGVRELPVHRPVLSDAARADVSMPDTLWMAEHHAYLRLMLDLARDGQERFDVVHNNSLHYLPVAMAPTLPLPVVTTLHTPPTPWMESAVQAQGQDACPVTFTAVSAHTAAAWHATAPAARVIRNGVDTHLWVVRRRGPAVRLGRRSTAGHQSDLRGAEAFRPGGPLPARAGPTSSGRAAWSRRKAPTWPSPEAVTRTEYARRKPLAYAAAVTEGLRRALDGDAAYSGLMTKNPLHVDWSTEWLHGGLHTLGGLEEALSGHMPSARWRETKRFRTNITGLGRNCSIFETARTWAYREVRHHFGNPGTLHTAIHAEVHTRNAEFTEPLPAVEARAIANSIHRWITTRSRMWKDGAAVYEATFVSIQSARGKKSGKARAARRDERAAAMLEYMRGTS
ncbi:replication initiation protein [Streptomyces cyaneofuscatus]|uniref:glycosyltransferase n=1 Tax=Streptomyces cyaneofuscatus TaxID=66883 RepID=UPI000A89B3C5|nr:replication initiation protein [Streptomyces cyaneofuscatus]